MIDSALNIFPQTITRLMNNEAVYRTAPATPGLLMTFKVMFMVFQRGGTGHWALSAILRNYLGLNWVRTLFPIECNGSR